MKKSIIIFLAAVMLMMSGCASSKTTNNQEPVIRGPETLWDEATSLMTGTLLLQTTSTPLDKEQASALLLLWNGYNSVITSSTSAQDEIDGLIAQIKEVFTDEQLKAIEGMELTGENYTDKLAEVGVIFGGPTMAQGDESSNQNGPMVLEGDFPPGGEITSNSSQNGEFRSSNGPKSSGGQMPGGGQMPSAGQMPGGMSITIERSDMGGGGDPSMLTTQATQQAGTGFTERTVNMRVLMAVIQYLNGFAEGQAETIR